MIISGRKNSNGGELGGGTFDPRKVEMIEENPGNGGVREAKGNVLGCSGDLSLLH